MIFFSLCFERDTDENRKNRRQGWENGGRGRCWGEGEDLKFEI